MDRRPGGMPHPEGKNKARMDHARAERPTRKIVPSLPSGEQPTPHHPLIAEQANVEQTKNQIYSKSPANMLQYNRL